MKVERHNRGRTLKEKLKVLKDVATGKKSIKELVYPKGYLVFINPEGTEFRVGDKIFNEQQYADWLKENEGIHHVIQFQEMGGCAPVTDKQFSNRNEKISKVIQPKKKKRKTKAIAKQLEKDQRQPPQLIPYEDHLRFNQILFDKIFR